MLVTRRISSFPSLSASQFIRSFHTSSQFKRISSSAQQWTQQITSPTTKLQAYLSKSRDVYTNLAIEYYLFQKTPPGSRILFLYVDKPCIVFGRNQNPWVEVDLKLLHSGELSLQRPDGASEQIYDHGTQIDLVRRRSGGGTVFHDGGNVNWSVICDMPEFTRDKHAEMVVRSLRSLGVQNARVNERHDVVLDFMEKSVERNDVDANDTHLTRWTVASDTQDPLPAKAKIRRPLKVSGSAYKLARNRALHHGTALLNTPNLGVISRVLKSPARAFISARGVESVSSPVGNIGITSEDFEKAILEEFNKMYSADGGRVEFEVIGDELLAVEGIEKDVKELKSQEWTYLQTPQFTLSTQPSPPKEGDTTSNNDPTFSMTAKYGAITGVDLRSGISKSTSSRMQEKLIGRRIHEIDDWVQVLGEDDMAIDEGEDYNSLSSSSSESKQPTKLSDFLTKIFPPNPPP